MREAIYEHQADYAEIVGVDDNRITVEYELIIDNCVKETTQVGVTILANNVVIDDHINITSGEFLQWGNIVGEIENQTDLMAEFSSVEDDIEAEALAREQAVTAEAEARELAVSAEATARGNADTALGGRIDSEATTRANADTAETTARTNADNALGLRIDGLNSAKADKVSGATSGDFASLDSSGNLADSNVTVSSVSTHLSSTSNPHGVTKAQVGLGNADNTSDLDKPISTATQTALNAKADKITTATDGNIVQFDENGNIEDSGVSVSGVTGDIEDIQALIPNQATSTNQLADKDFVNSSIQTATATPRGTFNLVNDLSLTTSASRSDIELALLNAVSVADTNDYCYVEIPTSDSTPTEILRYERYKYGTNSWVYEYILPNSGFTSAQWKALNSNITADREASYQTHINDGTVHVTTANKSAWNAKYDKPSGGIPSTDMISAVQTSLGKADSAYQKPSAGIPKTDLASGVQASLGLADTAYQKPSGGIPNTDLSSAVQTSLGNADTALQDGDAVPPYSVDATYWDTKPTDGSVKPVTSGGIADAISVDDGEHIEITNTGTIPSGVNSYALVHTLKGVSRVVNQIIPNSNMDFGAYTFDSDSTFYDHDCYTSLSIPLISGHAYLLGVNVTRSISTNNEISVVGWTSAISGNASVTVPNGSPNGRYFALKTASADGNITRISLNNYSGKRGYNASDSIGYADFTITDLTLYFNGGAVPTLAEIQQYYPELLEARAYNVGEIVDATYTSVTSLAQNLYSGAGSFEVQANDASYYSDSINVTAWQKMTVSLKIQRISGATVSNVNLYPVIVVPYIGSTEQTRIPAPVIMDFPSSGTVDTSFTFTVPTSVTSIKLYMGNNNGDANINTLKFGFFLEVGESHFSATLPIPSVTLKGAGSVSDTLDVESGEITRRISQSIDLSTLSWTASTSVANAYYATFDVGYKFIANVPAICDKYDYIGTTTGTSALTNRDKVCALYYSNGQATREVYVKDTSLSSASEITGHIQFEMATPTTDSVTPTPDNTLKIETGGTVYAEQSNEPEVDSDFIISYPSDIKSAIVRASGGGGSSVIVVDNLTTESSTSALSARQGKVLDDKIQGIVDIIYPVGSIYMSRNSTSPASLFGGTWTAIEDKFLMTRGSTYTQSGGSASVTLQEANLPAHSHGFTPEGSVSVETDPTFSGTSGTVSVSGANHRHTISGRQYSGSTWTTFAFSFHQARDSVNAYTEYSGNLSMSGSFTPSGTVSGGSYAFTGTSGDTDTTGSGTSFSILPPFDVVYAWERIA